MAVRHLLHHLHGQLVLVAGGVGIGEHRRHLVLGGGHLVVLRLGQDARAQRVSSRSFMYAATLGRMAPK